MLPPGAPHGDDAPLHPLLRSLLTCILSIVKSATADRAAARTLLRTPLVRFLLVGGSNTLATAAIALLLGFVIPGWLAFTCAFALGLVYSVLLTGRWVFRSRLTPWRAVAFVTSYLAIYLVGVTVVQLLAARGAPDWSAATSVLLTAPLSFSAGRAIFRPRASTATNACD